MKKIIILLSVIVLLIGCTSNGLFIDEKLAEVKSSENSTKKVSTNADNKRYMVENNNQNITETDAENIAIYVSINKVPITISQAESNAREVYKNLYPDSYEDVYFICESIQIVEKKIHYLIRGYSNTNTHRATFAWYFVDVYTGTVYDAGPGINELIEVTSALDIG